MSFDLGSTYERQSDRMTAIVAKTDEKNALLWLSTGEEEWFRPADVPSLWRRYVMDHSVAGSFASRVAGAHPRRAAENIAAGQLSMLTTRGNRPVVGRGT
jgi:hypothetical protein